MAKTHVYDAIDDWTPAGRRRLMDSRGDEIRALLDLGFTEFVETHEVGLSAFGFHEDDPVGEAVEWAICRFVSAEIDPDRLHLGSRTFRLFTETRFWLHQKVGRDGYSRIMAACSNKTASDDEAVARVDSGSMSEPIEVFARTLASTLRTLRDCTCADIVAFWLEATKTMRREWFGWRERGEVSDAGASFSKKQRSFCGHDAMFRFLCLLHDIVPQEPDLLAERVFWATMLSPCENVPPYRVPDRAVIPQFVALGVRAPRAVAHLRKEGIRLCLQRCFACASWENAERILDRLTVELTRRSLGPTTLHALGLEAEVGLREQIDAFSQASAGSSI